MFQRLSQDGRSSQVRRKLLNCGFVSCGLWTWTVDSALLERRELCQDTEKRKSSTASTRQVDQHGLSSARDVRLFGGNANQRLRRHAHDGRKQGRQTTHSDAVPQTCARCRILERAPRGHSRHAVRAGIP